MAFWNWSKTASSNGGADTSINWQEGQSPSSVNDSARAMMARLAEFRDDQSGLLLTGGTATALTLATNEGILTPTPTDGQLISFTMSVTNGINPTLAVDGGTAFVIESGRGVSVAPGSLIAGSPYTAKFSAFDSAWMLRNFYGAPFSVPLGAMLPFTGDFAPNSNFALPIGQAISRATYATYFAQVGTRFGAGDGVSTFNIPDMRERTIYGSGNIGGAADPGRMDSGTFGANPNIIGSVGGRDRITIGVNNLPAYTLPNSLGIVDTQAWNVVNGNNVVQDAAGSKYGGGGVGAAVNLSINRTGSISISGDVTSGGSGVAAYTVSPGIILGFILRVL